MRYQGQQPPRHVQPSSGTEVPLEEGLPSPGWKVVGQEEVRIRPFDPEAVLLAVRIRSADGMEAVLSVQRIAAGWAAAPWEEHTADGAMEEAQREARSSADLTMIRRKHRDSTMGSSHPLGTVAAAVAFEAAAAAAAEMTAAEPALVPDHQSFHFCLQNTWCPCCQCRPVNVKLGWSGVSCGPSYGNVCRRLTLTANDGKLGSGQ